MLEIAESLPDAVLLNGERRTLARAIESAGGLWLDAAPDWLDLDAEGMVAAWRPAVGAPTAIPALPNRGHAAPGPRGIRLNPGVNCGFWLPEITADASAFSFAILFHGGDLLTALTLNLREEKNYLFLSQSGGSAGFKSQGQEESLTVRIPAEDTRLLVAGFSGGRYHLRTDKAVHVSDFAPDPGIGGPADLFIACRSNREGLSKTLGGGVIAAVMFWPVNILDPALPEGKAQLAALDAWRFWEG